MTGALTVERDITDKATPTIKLSNYKIPTAGKGSNGIINLELNCVMDSICKPNICFGLVKTVGRE